MKTADPNHLDCRHAATTKVAARVLWSLLFVGFVFDYANAGQIQMSLRYPAGTKQVPQPTGMCVDSRGDIYVADGPGGRIAIFDSRGLYEYEFSTQDRLAGPQQIAADSAGRIFVFGYSRDHTLAVFDYNGDFLHYLDLKYPSSDSLLDPTSFVLRNDNQLLFLCARPAHIYVFTTCGDFTGDFPILQEMDDATRDAPVLGSFAVINDMLVIPLPMLAQVVRYSMDGKFVDLFGMAGGGPRELSFPVAVTTDGRDGVLVLDKHRHTVLHYDHSGQYLDEFGGSGHSEGWFYHPTVMVPFGDGKCLVAQSFENRIQSVEIFESTAGDALARQP